MVSILSEMNIPVSAAAEFLLEYHKRPVALSNCKAKQTQIRNKIPYCAKLLIGWETNVYWRK